MKDTPQEIEVEVVRTNQAAEVIEEDLTGGTVQVLPMPEPMPADLATGIARVRQYVDAGEKMFRAGLAMHVMAGFELLDLRKASPYSRGGDRKSAPGSNRHCGGLIENTPFSAYPTWDSFVSSGLGLAPRTVERWMKMAEAVKPRLKRLTGWGDLVRDLIERPITELSPEECETLTKAVSKLTDGRTQLDFMVELGLVKSPGNPNLGGATMGGGRKPGALLDEDAIAKAARADWELCSKSLVTIGATFTVLPDSEIEAQIELLQRALSARRKWLSVGTLRRDSTVVDEIARSLR
jgi:hypothetical protein